MASSPPNSPDFTSILQDFLLSYEIHACFPLSSQDLPGLDTPFTLSASAETAFRDTLPPIGAAVSEAHLLDAHLNEYNIWHAFKKGSVPRLTAVLSDEEQRKALDKFVTEAMLSAGCPQQEMDKLEEVRDAVGRTRRKMIAFCEFHARGGFDHLISGSPVSDIFSDASLSFDPAFFSAFLINEPLPRIPTEPPLKILYTTRHQLNGTFTDYRISTLPANTSYASLIKHLNSCLSHRLPSPLPANGWSYRLLYTRPTTTFLLPNGDEELLSSGLGLAPFSTWLRAKRLGRSAEVTEGEARGWKPLSGSADFAEMHNALKNARDLLDEHGKMTLHGEGEVQMETLIALIHTSQFTQRDQLREAYRENNIFDAAVYRPGSVVESPDARYEKLDTLSAFLASDSEPEPEPGAEERASSAGGGGGDEEFRYEEPLDLNGDPYFEQVDDWLSWAEKQDLETVLRSSEGEGRIWLFEIKTDWDVLDFI